MQTQRLFPITEASQTAEARRAISELARTLGFNETDTGKVALVVTEAATNLLKHAKQGQLIVRAIERAGIPGLELLALDRGPGITNVNKALQDGYSTTGSSGTGLGAMMRLAAEFDLYSQVGGGTALLTRFWLKPLPAAITEGVQVGVVSLPKAGEQVCGDQWAVQPQRDRCLLVVADGLGHGPEAAKAAQAAVQTLAMPTALPPTALMEDAHRALRSTRGAAVALVELQWPQQLVRFVGIGNISALVLDGANRRHLVSHNGIVGHEMRKLQEFTTPWNDGALLILHSDGLATHWNLTDYAGLTTHDPSLIAGVLYRDFTRGRDDVTVVVVKQA
ncbi:MAG: ATP-binding SpoIIE family protein phosphatase [Caldilineaceae bacterium]